MRRLIAIAVASVMILSAVSCGNRSGKQPSAEMKKPLAGLVAIDSLKAGKPFSLCEQKLTSLDGINAAFPDSCENYDVEMTPARYAFFFPEKDIRPSKIVSLVRTKYNMACVVNRVVHGYEWFNRYSSAIEDSLVTRKDTLAWIRNSQPAVSSGLLAEAIPDDSARKNAKELLAAYRRFDGNSDEGSDLDNAFARYNEVFSIFPNFTTNEMLNSFKTNFWEWYDKAQFVPEVDDIIRLNLNDKPKYEITDEQLNHFREAVLAERDIDRRAILALEYAKFDSHEGMVLLGEIIESGIYTRYLLETWISWRANVQMYHALSSFAVIPDNYYDRLRVKCMNTLLRHYQDTGDEKDLCFLENFIYVQVLHRQGAISGNESLAILANLSYGMFIHPRITGKDYLKEE